MLSRINKQGKYRLARSLDGLLAIANPLGDPVHLLNLFTLRFGDLPAKRHEFGIGEVCFDGTSGSRRNGAESWSR